MQTWKQVLISLLLCQAVLSLKVLQELPIIVVLMYQLYKNYVHPEVCFHFLKTICFDLHF